MQTLTIKSRKTDQIYDFSMSSAGGYVWLSRRRDILDGQQICAGGSLRGDTTIATPENFKQICRQWYRAYTKGI